MSANQDKRALWNDSPELRDDVRAVLQEWGDAVRGGWPPLGYPVKCPFTVAPSKGEPPFNMERVESVTDTIMLWNMIQRQEPDVDRRANILRLLLILRVHFVAKGPAEAKAKRFKVSRRTYWRLVDESMFRFWVLHY